MAADQLNKRSKVNNVVRHTSWEMQKAKKKKYSHYDLNTKSSISLVWDDKKEEVVPKKQQISIASRELTPFLPLVGNNQNVIGDVFAVPPELFELNNLNGVLSFEVWQTYLSAEEREFLTKFLPDGVDLHTNVYELLVGNNFCFGNPFRKWGASVCSDDCHPDSVLRQEQCNKANKVAYYSELHEYHTKMIGTLQLLKEKWEIGMNPENVRLQMTPRSRNDTNKIGPSHENGIQYGPENNLVATTDSCSSDADDKSYTSDSPPLAITNGETSKRVSKTDSGNKYYDSSGGRSAARPKKEDKVRRQNTESGDDGAKYMSYIKVSKEQHERVKSSMKHSNTSIQPKSLNHVLGNLGSFRVQPFKVFEEEERQKLHDYWLHLAKKDVPAGFEIWKSWGSAKWQLTKSLRKEMEDKWKSNDLPTMDLCDQDKEFVIGGQDEAQSQSQSISNPCHEQVDGETNGVLVTAPEENVEQNDDSFFRSEAELNASNHEIADESRQDSDQNQHLPHITIHNNTQNVCPMAIDTNNDVLIESNTFPSTFVEYTENVNHTVASIGEPFPPISTASEIWPPVSLPPSVYYNQPTSVTHGYPSISELSLRQGQSSFYNPYGNQDRDELLLHSLYKDPGSSHYLHEQKLSSLRFHPSGNDSIMGISQFPRNISSSWPLGPRHDFRENLFTIPRQEPLLPLNHVHDWPVNGGGGVNLPIPASSHHRLSHGGGGVNLPIPASSHHRLSQNWFSADEVSRVGWSGAVVPNQELGNSEQVSDESLFSVLSQCNALRPGVHFGSTGAMDQFIQPGNYLGVGRGLPTTTNTMPPRDTRGPGLNYTSGNEAQLGWMNLPGGKSFPRLWNEKDIG